MSVKTKSAKRSPRQHPCKPRGIDSKGLRAGARRTILTAGAKILLGGGVLQRKEKAGGFTPDERSDFGKYMQQRQRTILGER